MKLDATTWQTVGPFFSLGLEHLYTRDLAGEGVAGDRIRVQGQVLDGDGLPIPDCVVEVWQANSFGKYAHPDDKQGKPLEENFRGFGRIATDDTGHFLFTTVKPGKVPGPNGHDQAPHLLIFITMRGLLRGLSTRAYFAGEPANDADAILGIVPVERRDTLMMKSSSTDPALWVWTIRMQDPVRETVFFEY